MNNYSYFSPLLLNFFVVNFTFSPSKFTTIQNISKGVDNYKFECRMELITCPSCRIHVEIK